MTDVYLRHLVNNWNVKSSYIGVWNAASPIPSWRRLGGDV